MLPEMPQGDMSADPTLPLTDPCYPFVDISNHQFFSPGYPADTYTNNTDCVVVIEGLSITIESIIYSKKIVALK